MTRAPEASSLFTAKLSPPRLRAPSVRADQLEQVAHARDVKLLLVQAPAGFGKTTLVAAAAETLGWQSVWYRLDALDAEPRAFLHSLACAVRRRLPGFGEALLEELGEPEQARVQESAAAFVRELQHVTREDLFLVLDDYEALGEAAPLDALFAALLGLLPPHVHMVILSRRRPTFELAKPALDGELGEISHAVLRFDGAQVAAVVRRQSSIVPTQAAVEQLLQLTEGWAAGVVLAVNALRWMDPDLMEEALAGRDFERELFPYLAEQVFARQSRELQEFLRSTCYLEALTADLAMAVTGSTRTEDLLEQLTAGEVFTFADTSGVHRYHSLFRRFLQARQLREEGRDACTALRRHTAAALAAHGLLAASVELYLTLDEPQSLLMLLREHGHGLLEQCSEAQLARTIAVLGQAESRGWAALVDGHRLLQSGSPAAARRRLSAALQSLDGDPAGRYLALRELGHLCYATGALDEAVTHARAALTLAEPEHEAECLTALALTFSGACRWTELDEALAAFEARGPAAPRLTATMAALKVNRAYGMGDLRAALAAAEEALPAVLRHASRLTAVCFVNSLAVLNCLAGRYEKASLLLSQAQAECAAHGLTKPIVELELTQATMLAQEGRLEEALAVFAEAEAAPRPAADAMLLVELHLRRAAALRRAGRLDEAASCYAQALRLADHLAPYDRLNAQLGLTFTDQLRGGLGGGAEQLRPLGEEAARLQLHFHEAEASFFLAVLTVSHGSGQECAVGAACAELVRLGQLDFLGQELATYPAAALALLAAGLDEETLAAALCALAPQPGGPALLASLAATGERPGRFIVEVAGRCLSAAQRLTLLTELLRRVEGRVRESAIRLLAPDGCAGRLFPELTPREEEVLSLLAQGCSNREIAERLSLEVATVKSHVHRVLTTTQARGRLAAALLYQERAAAESGRHASDGAA